MPLLSLRGCPRCLGTLEHDAFEELRCIACGYAGPTHVHDGVPLGGKMNYDHTPRYAKHMTINCTLWWHDESKPHWGLTNESVRSVDVEIMGHPHSLAGVPRYKVLGITTVPPVDWDSTPPRHRADFKRILCEVIQKETSLEIKAINIPNALLTNTG